MISSTINLRVYTEQRDILLATQPDFIAEMSLAGTVVEYQPSGFWWDGIPEEQWPKDEESLVLSNRIGMINWRPLPN